MLQLSRSILPGLALMPLPPLRKYDPYTWERVMRGEQEMAHQNFAEGLMKQASLPHRNAFHPRFIPPSVWRPSLPRSLPCC